LKAIPWTYDARPDTHTTNVRVGLWLFLASEAMFFGSLFSGYVLLRAGAESWPDASQLLDLPLALLNTALLSGSVLLLLAIRNEGPGFRSRTRLGRTTVAFAEVISPVTGLSLSAGLGAVFLAVKAFEYQSKLGAGLHPSTNILLACWFTLTAVHALHVAAGVAVNAWLAANARRMRPPQAIERLHAARLYWLFVDAVWIVILVSFYFV
jgi:cytochrome c oxidase subunit 3